MKTLTILAVTVALAAGLGAPATTRAQTASLPADSLEIGRRYATWLLTSQVDSLAAHMSAGTLSALGGRDGLTQTMADVAARAGQALAVVEERFVWRNKQRQYWQARNMSVLGEPLLIRIVIAPSGEMTGLGLNPQSAAPPIDSGGPPIRRPD